MPSKFGNFIFKSLTFSDRVHRYISNFVISKITDSGPLPGLYSTKQQGRTSLWEMLHKEYFALEVPTPDASELEDLPELDVLSDMLKRRVPTEESRVSLLLPLFAQHLTDAVFQSDGEFGTNAPHEIILNQIYGNTPDDEVALRLHENGKLKTQTRQVNGRDAEFPDALLEEKDGEWVVKDRYKGLSYLDRPGRIKLLQKRYPDREGDICATGLFQGNMTLGNFTITTLMMREHNRLCEGILEERRRKGQSTDDEVVFKIAQQNNVTAYMKVVIEDYINAFAGQKLFKLDTKGFFYERKRWCRETPLPYHFNILYRLHSMMPDTLKGFEDRGFDAFGANNQLVMQNGIGQMLQTASNQGASQVSLGNTPEGLLNADKGGLKKAREKLGFFNSHREVQVKGSSLGFDAYDPKYSGKLRELYKNNPNRVEYAIGILAERPQTGLLDKLGIKDKPIIGSTLMNAIAKHAFRHILSNRFMTREYLNPDVLGDFGWDNLHNTSTVAELVKRNVSGEMDQVQADNLKIGFANPN